MRRYYMHFIDEHGAASDDEGFAAVDADAARDIGMKAAGDIIAEAMGRGQSTIAFMLCLDDQNRRRIATLPVTATVAAFFEDCVAAA
jgi:hypothetical protein